MRYTKLVLASRVKRYEIWTASHDSFNYLCNFLNSSLLKNAVACRYNILRLIRVFYRCPQTEVGLLLT